MKKFLAIMLAAILTLSMFSVVSLAADDIYTAIISVTYEQSTARAMFDLINDMRQSDEAWYWNEDNSKKIVLNGLKPLIYDYQLEETAMQRAAEIAVYYSHQRPNGERCFTAYDGYYTAGENIAYGYRTYESVFNAWAEKDDLYDGQGHRRNMLNGNFTAVGIGHVILNGVHYWVQEFRNPASSKGYTDPVDGIKKVTFSFSKSFLPCGNLTADKTALSLGLSDTVNLPKLSYTVNGRTVFPAEVTATVNNSDVVTVSGGKITAARICTAVLTLSAFGEKTKIKITVHPEKDVHCMDEGIRTSELSCTEDGITIYTCTVCGAEETKIIPATGHNWGEWVVVKNSTEDKTVIKERTCNNCKENETEVIPVSAPAYILGDADMNGEITAADARLALRISVNLDTAEPGSAAFLACDTDGSGTITAADARAILRAAVGLEKIYLINH